MRSAFEAIILYLADHPSANDTLQGVMQWWLFAEGIAWSRAQIEEALVQGVEEGWILETRGGDGQVRYSLMPGKFAEIRACLQRDPES